MKIGFFDSGIGGISVLHEALKLLPEEEFIFYADTDHVPYGSRTKEDIIKLTTDSVRFLVNAGCVAVVIACNTATSAAIRSLRETFTIPVIGIEPAVKPAVANRQNKRVMVVATEFTVREEKLKNLIARFDEDNSIDVLALQKLVNFAQDGDFSSKELKDYLSEKFAPYNLSDYSELVLGCTHFTFFKDVLAEFFPDDTEIIDGNLGTVKNLAQTVASLRDASAGGSQEQNGKITYYYSGRPVTDTKELTMLDSLHKRLDMISN